MSGFIHLVKFILILILVNIIVADEDKSIKCYICTEECKITDKTEQRSCGLNIGPTQTAYCVKEWRIGTNHSDVARRRCVIAKKGDKPKCEDGYECDDFCQTDLCNTATNKLPMDRFSIVFTSVLVLLLKPMINLIYN